MILGLLSGIAISSRKKMIIPYATLRKTKNDKKPSTKKRPMNPNRLMFLHVGTMDP